MTTLTILLCGGLLVLARLLRRDRDAPEYVSAAWRAAFIRDRRE